MRELRRDDARQRAPRRLQHRRGGHPALRGGPGQRGPVHRRPRPGTRDRLHQERDRGHQPGRPRLGPHPPAARRRGGPDRDGAPRQHRAVATCWPPSGGSSCDGCPSTTTASSTSTISTGSSRARSSWRSPACPTCSAPSLRCAILADGRARRRRDRGGRRLLSRCPICRRTWSPSESTSSAFSGHKMLGPDRDRRALGPRRAAGRPCRRSSVVGR